VRADINKLTTGPLNVDLWLRVPYNPMIIAMVVTNGVAYSPAVGDLDSGAGRVHIRTSLSSAPGTNSIIVTYNLGGCGGCPCPSSDWDGDGLGDNFELMVGSNPLNADTDADSLPDGWEYNYFGSPTDAVAAADVDGDSFTALQEYWTGTDPTNSASFFHVLAAVLVGNDVQVSWMAGGGRTNMLQYTTGAVGGNYSNNFTDIAPAIILPSSGTSLVTNQIDAGGATNGSSRYYRIRLVP
jgi:hypothetical protein